MISPDWPKMGGGLPTKIVGDSALLVVSKTAYFDDWEFWEILRRKTTKAKQVSFYTVANSKLRATHKSIVGERPFRDPGQSMATPHGEIASHFPQIFVLISMGEISETQDKQWPRPRAK